jgi:creatinine amidohydrolase/Fe(II)-dependent formamide hydrolase-like protein
VQGMFAGGVKSISASGTVGDPSRASAEHGRRYWEAALDLALELVESAG